MAPFDPRAEDSVNDALRQRLIESGVLRPSTEDHPPQHSTSFAARGHGILLLDEIGKRESSRPVLVWAWDAPKEFARKHLGRRRLKL